MNWISSNIDRIISLTTSHTWLTLVPTIIGLLIALPLGWWAHKFKRGQAAIVADTGLRAPTIPVDIAITSGTDKHVEKGSFHVELLANKFLTPSLAGAAVMNAINYYLPDRDNVTARVESRVQLAGQEPIHFVDYIYANDGAASVMGAVRGLRVLVPLLLNPYAPVSIERVELKVDLRFDVDGAVPPDAVERAIALSREKYCSVWHSLNHDIDFQVTCDVHPQGSSS